MSLSNRSNPSDHSLVVEGGQRATDCVGDCTTGRKFALPAPQALYCVVWLVGIHTHFSIFVRRRMDLDLRVAPPRQSFVGLDLVHTLSIRILSD